jgi:hypothetical protein
MKTIKYEIAEYARRDGTKLKVLYNPSALCIYCNEPVMAASMGGTIICPWCDSGYNRDGTKWTYREMMDRFKNAQKYYEKMPL